MKARLYAFLYLRGFKIWYSYKTQMVLNVLSWVLPVFTYYFVGTSLGRRLVSTTGVTNYTAFIVIGLAFQGYVSSVITTLSQRIRNEQLYGTIEYYLLSPLNVTGFLLYSALWGFVLNTVNAVVILAAGAGLGVKYSITDLPISLLIVFELIISTLGFAMISGGISVVVKAGNPISFFFSTFTSLMSGTVFPVSVLPTVVRDVSYAIPLTWALQGLRETMLAGAPLYSVLPILEVLGIFDIILIPLGLAVYRYCFNLARRRGTLGEY